MKKILSVLLIMLLLCTVSIFGYSQTATGHRQKNNLEICFNRSSGLTELILIRDSLAKRGIVLSYRKIEYNDRNDLKALHFSVDFRDGFSGSASTESLRSDVKFGFYRDYTANASSPFSIGYLEESL